VSAKHSQWPQQPEFSLHSGSPSSSSMARRNNTFNESMFKAEYNGAVLMNDWPLLVENEKDKFCLRENYSCPRL
jgi:hypothetical protein